MSEAESNALIFYGLTSFLLSYNLLKIYSSDLFFSYLL